MAIKWLVKTGLVCLLSLSAGAGLALAADATSPGVSNESSSQTTVQYNGSGSTDIQQQTANDQTSTSPNSTAGPTSPSASGDSGSDLAPAQSSPSDPTVMPPASGSAPSTESAPQVSQPADQASPSGLPSTIAKGLNQVMASFLAGPSPSPSQPVLTSTAVPGSQAGPKSPTAPPATPVGFLQQITSLLAMIFVPLASSVPTYGGPVLIMLELVALAVLALKLHDTVFASYQQRLARSGYDGAARSNVPIAAPATIATPLQMGFIVVRQHW